MARGRRGGYRRPGSPAAVSGPGALSQRTDGGPGGLEYSGLGYGENKAVNDLAASAPMGQPSSGAPAPAQGGGPRLSPDGIFGMTDRPGEPITAGVGSAPPPIPDDDVDYTLRAVIASDVVRSNPALAEYLLGLLRA